LSGNFLGKHEGIELFTVGQRKGLPGGSAEPRYVVDIDAQTNRVIVGGAEDVVSDEFEIDRVNWIGEATEDSLEATVKIRYSHPGTAASVRVLDENRAKVQLHSPQKAVTPGQAAVIYNGDVVLGGGWICRRAALVPA
jgi:tRNA-uridine 2-sulfurtransferase